MQVEIDLLKPLPKRLWIGLGDSFGFWQKVEPDEDIPAYCQYCWHSETACHVKHPELKAVSKDGVKEKNLPKESNQPLSKAKLVYRPKALQSASSAADCIGITSSRYLS